MTQGDWTCGTISEAFWKIALGFVEPRAIFLCNHSVTWGKPVDLAGILPEVYQVRVHVMGNICCSLIQPYKDYLVSVDTKERWHYKVLSLSLPDLQNPVRLIGYFFVWLFVDIFVRDKLK